MVEKLGKCPRCGTNWNSGDVHEHIARMEVFTGRDYRQTLHIAAKLGYSPDNKNNFTKVKVHELLDGTILLECPNIRCGHVFNMETEKEWDSMYEYHKASKVLAEEVLNPEDYVVGVDPYKKEGWKNVSAIIYKKEVQNVQKQAPDSRRIIFNNKKRRWGR